MPDYCIKQKQKKWLDADLNTNPHSCDLPEQLTSTVRLEIDTIDTAVCIGNHRQVTLMIMCATLKNKTKKKRFLSTKEALNPFSRPKTPWFPRKLRQIGRRRSSPPSVDKLSALNVDWSSESKSPGCLAILLSGCPLRGVVWSKWAQSRGNPFA